MNKNLKKIKGLVPFAKKVLPLASKALQSFDLLENTTLIAKPFVDKAHEKHIEKTKRIYVHQASVDDKIILSIKAAGIEVVASNEDKAFAHLIQQLKGLRQKRVLSHNRKIRVKQLKLIERINHIIQSGGKLEDYIYRIDVNPLLEEKSKSNIKQPRQGVLIKRFRERKARRQL